MTTANQIAAIDAELAAYAGQLAALASEADALAAQLAATRARVSEVAMQIGELRVRRARCGSLTRIAAGRYAFDEYEIARHASGWRWFNTGDLAQGGEWRASLRDAFRDLAAHLDAAR